MFKVRITVSDATKLLPLKSSILMMNKITDNSVMKNELVTMALK